jgi:uncharacterized membrane protein YfcA
VSWEYLAWAFAGAGLGAGVNELFRRGYFRQALGLMQLQIALYKMRDRSKAASKSKKPRA